MENGNDERLMETAKFFRPIIEALKELGGSAKPKEVVPKVIADMQIGSADDDEQKKLEKGILWARNSLKNAGLISAETRGVWSLTDEGRNIDLTVAAANKIKREENRQYVQKRAETSEHWLYDDHDTGITTERWVELLSDAAVFNEESLIVVACIKDKGGAASCKELAESYGRSPGFYNAHSLHTAKRVAEKTGCALLQNKGGGNAYWPYPLRRKACTSKRRRGVLLEAAPRSLGSAKLC